MPKADQLPEDLRELAYRNSVELTHARWKSDVQVLGLALEPYLATDSNLTAPVVNAPVPKEVTPSAAAPAAFDAAAVSRVTHELAYYIGPIAEVVVKRAARRCDSLPDLCNLVAQEIEASRDRARFLASCSR